MSVTNTPRKAGPYTGNNTDVQYTFGFKVFADSDLVVTRAVIATGAESTLVLTTDYSVTRNADQDVSPGGHITLTAALADTYTLTLTSAVPDTQPAVFTNLGGFFPAVLNNALDRLTVLVQQLKETVSRSLKLAVSTPTGFDATLPAPVAYGVLGFNGTADGFAVTDPSGAAAISADLLDDTSASKGAGMVGIDLTLSYAAGTVGALLRESAVNVRGAPYYAGGVAVNDATAIQAAIDDNPNGAVYIPNPPNGGRAYSLTSGLSIATAATTWIYGDETLINVTGDITALTVTDVAGVKGGIVGIHFYQTSNTYSSGGKVDFAAAPNSIGIKCRDTFQFRIINCTVEQFGVGLLLNNYAYWCEGTYLQGVWLRNNKVGWKCLREGSGTDSLSHTQAWGVKIQIPRDNTGGVPGNWCDGLVVDGGGVGALQIYNAFLNIHFWTGDAASAPYAGSGNFVKLLNVGRIAGSFLTWTFERYGKINISASSYIDQPTCHVFMSSLDAAQLEITDANATGAKFRSYYVGNISKNLNFPGAFSNWRGSGNAGTYQHGESFSSATGHHYVDGTGINSHLLTHLAGSANGVFFAATADHEGNLPLPHSYIVERGAYFPTLRSKSISAAVTGAGPTSYTTPQATAHIRLTGCVSPLTITLPSESVANDGQEVVYLLDASVAAVSWLSPSGASRATLPAAGTVSVPIRCKYNSTDNAWYPT